MINKQHAKATLRLQDITKGAVRYQEVDTNGDDLKMMNPETLIGTQYFRQGKFKAFRDKDGNWPTYITITITPGAYEGGTEA